MSGRREIGWEERDWMGRREIGWEEGDRIRRREIGRGREIG